MTKVEMGLGEMAKKLGKMALGEMAVKPQRHVCQVPSDSFQNVGARAEDCTKVNLAENLNGKRRFLKLSSIGSDRNLVDTYRVPLDI